MRPQYHTLSTCLRSALLAGLLAAAVAPALAANGPQYVALRRQHNCDRKLSFADVHANPYNYVGRVLELRGRVGGRVESEDGVTVMLNLPDRNAVNLDIPKAEAAIVREYDTPDVRVLVKIEETSGNVVPMTVLAVVHESEVRALERREEARMAAVAAARKAEQKRQQQLAAQRSARYSVGRGVGTVVASRGARRSGSAFSQGEVTRQANYYTPYLRNRARGLYAPYFDFISRWNPRLSASDAGSITYHLLHFADMNEIDPRLVVALVIAESDFNPNATSRVGAAGLGQLMPGTARDLGLNNPYDPVQNLYGSVRYLRDRLSSFGVGSAAGGNFSFEQVALALAAYNAGPGAVRKHKGVPPYRETQAYVRKVISLYQWLNPDWRQQ